jgi:PilZ domain
MNSRPKSDSRDKRRHPRHARRIPCELFVRGQRHSGTVVDVSRAGLFVESDAKAPPGTPVTLLIAADQGRTRTEIRVTGRVARSDRIQPVPAETIGGLGIEVTQPGAMGRLIGDLRLTVGEGE